MKIAIAPDSFKETLSALEVAEAIEKGVLDASPGITTVLVPMADGGEGTVDAVVNAAHGRFHTATVPDPLGRPVEAAFGLIDNDTCAVVEMAAASGLHLLSTSERNPLQTSTRGTGALIRNAMEAGATRIIVGVGGSATVDCGAGMAAELGFEFIDSQGHTITNPCGGDLMTIEHIATGNADRRIGSVTFMVACDVTNPLTGPRGAARVYGPQKGADLEMTDRLEEGIEHFADVIKRELNIDVAGMDGAGAAGGLAAGLVAFAGADLRSGVETVIEAVDLDSRLTGCDLVITGEGKADEQSVFGKTPAGVAAAARRAGVPTVILAGRLGEGYRELYEHGICAAFAIQDGPMPEEEAFENTPRLLRQTAESVIRLFQKSRKEN